MAVIREATGMLGDLKGLASTGVRAVRTRLELLTIELKEEKAWLVRLLIVAIAALYLLTFGLLLGILALALWASEENRPLIVAVAAGIFLAGGAGSVGYILVNAKKRHPLFENTLAVLKGDERALQQRLQGTGDD
jgi:uncharacterized membrane protein YqjE